MLIFLSGGGTMGSVSPLLALAQELRCARPDTRFVWIGTRSGPERKLVEEAGIPFRAISAGKWARYFTFRNLVAPFLFLLGFFQSLLLLFMYRPQAVMSAGSFVSVPLVWAGFLLRVPVIVHQQDINVGLANKLMTLCATKITVTFQEQMKLFPHSKVVWTGNPVRQEILQGDRAKATELFKLEPWIPTLLVTGGGTGAEFLNKLVVDALPDLTKFCQVIHLTGMRGFVDIPSHSRYHSYEFLTFEMAHALAVADLVVCRAGMGTITELAALGKPAILIPMPKTHQEDNAAFFAARQAVEVFDQRSLTPEMFAEKVYTLLTSVSLKEQFSENIKHLMPSSATTCMVRVLDTYL